MKAMILAAGRGERMRPLTDRVPKPLLPVADKPLIVHHLEALSRAGFGEVVINLSWLGEQIRDLLGDGADFGLSIAYSEEPEALETAGGILQALPRLGERFVVVNADIYTDYDFALLREADSPAHLVLVENPPHHPEGDFSLEDSRVGNADSPRYTFSGIAQYRREFFAGLAAGKLALAPLLREAADRGEVSGELFAGDWTDIGTPERLDALNRPG
ncbi:MAG: nucleotidyltransferase family protein [Gammaproteobacteria bacterium]